MRTLSHIFSECIFKKLLFTIFNCNNIPVEIFQKDFFCSLGFFFPWVWFWFGRFCGLIFCLFVCFYEQCRLASEINSVFWSSALPLSPQVNCFPSLPLVSLIWRCCLSLVVQNKHTTFSPGSWFMQNTALLREWKFTHKTFFQQQDSRGNLIRIFKDVP